MTGGAEWCCESPAPHQIGNFETIASWSAYHALRNRLEGVTAEQVQAAAVKHLAASNRTIGWFEPQK